MYTLDTNLIIYYFKDDFEAVTVLKSIFAENQSIYISAITELELFSFSDLTLKETKQIDNILATLKIIPVDSEIARLAGSLRRNYGLKTPDSAIAATALRTKSILVTRNVSDFIKVKNLKLLDL